MADLTAELRRDYGVPGHRWCRRRREAGGSNWCLWVFPHFEAWAYSSPVAKPIAGSCALHPGHHDGMTKPEHPPSDFTRNPKSFCSGQRQKGGTPALPMPNVSITLTHKAFSAALWRDEWPLPFPQCLRRGFRLNWPLQSAIRSFGKRAGKTGVGSRPCAFSKAVA